MFSGLKGGHCNCHQAQGLKDAQLVFAHLFMRRNWVCGTGADSSTSSSPLP